MMSTLSIDVFIISIKVCFIFILSVRKRTFEVNSNYHKWPAINKNINLLRNRLIP